MIKSISTKLFIALILLTSACASFAAHERGAYLEGNIGTLYESLDFFGIEFHEFGSVGLNANLGYQFNRYLAAEFGYTAYGINHHLLNNVDLAGKFILPFTIGNNNFNVFAKLGVADVFSGHDNSLLPMAGLGASYELTQNLDLNVQAQGVTQGFFSLGLLSTGLTYHFN